MNVTEDTAMDVSDHDTSFMSTTSKGDCTGELEKEVAVLQAQLLDAKEELEQVMKEFQIEKSKNNIFARFFVHLFTLLMLLIYLILF